MEVVQVFLNKSLMHGSHTEEFHVLTCETSILVLFLSLEFADSSRTVLGRRINMAGLSSKRVPYLVDALHAAVTGGV